MHHENDFSNKLQKTFFCIKCNYCYSEIKYYLESTLINCKVLD